MTALSLTTSMTGDWTAANQRYLTLALDGLRAALRDYVTNLGAASLPGEPVSLRAAALNALAAEMTAPPALELLRERFGLSQFERDLLLLCAAVELDARIGPLLAEVHGDAAKTTPTFGLALGMLAGSHWSAITPGGPLRSWRLLEIGAGPSLTQSPLRIDERVLHVIAGIQQLDDRLTGLIDPLPAVVALVPSHQEVVERVAAAWQNSPADAPLPVLQLCGRDVAGKRGIVTSACALSGLQPYVVSANSLPTVPADLDGFARLWEREVVLSARGLLLDCEEFDGSDPVRVAVVRRLIERLGGPLIVACRERMPIGQRQSVAFEIEIPNLDEQGALWHAALGETAAQLNGHVSVLLSQFKLSAAEIQSASASALGAVPDDMGARLWEACRVQSRARLDDLAQRIVSPATWDDLVLPDAQRTILHEIAIHVRQRTKVYRQWGFAGKGARGLGISALFAGTSGTGKTMAAEVLANELRLDLYRIDLASVVSKYIGETEKNLRRLFDAAEAGGAILLFDEADALFGKRSEVKDSHDRYANIEVSYLLQRIEAYTGLAILTTNLKNALDTAFLRRIRFVVHFPFPDAVQRAEIWRRVFPQGTPTARLRFDALSRLNVAGGNIYNIALNAAFLAAEDGEPVSMHHLLEATRSECAKIEKPLTAAEVMGWV